MREAPLLWPLRSCARRAALSGSLLPGPRDLRLMSSRDVVLEPANPFSCPSQPAGTAPGALALHTRVTSVGLFHAFWQSEAL